VTIYCTEEKNVWTLFGHDAPVFKYWHLNYNIFNKTSFQQCNDVQVPVNISWRGRRAGPVNETGALQRPRKPASKVGEGGSTDLKGHLSQSANILQ
jgi:hypothetical protein